MSPFWRRARLSPNAQAACAEARAHGWAVSTFRASGLSVVELSREVQGRRAAAVLVDLPSGAPIADGWTLRLAPLALDDSLSGSPTFSLTARSASWRPMPPPPGATNTPERALPPTGDSLFDQAIAVYRKLEATPDLATDQERDAAGVRIAGSDRVRRVLRELSVGEGAEASIHVGGVDLHMRRSVAVAELSSWFGRLAELADAVVAALRPSPAYR